MSEEEEDYWRNDVALMTQKPIGKQIASVWLNSVGTQRDRDNPPVAGLMAATYTNKLVYCNLCGKALYSKGRYNQRYDFASSLFYFTCMNKLCLEGREYLMFEGYDTKTTEDWFDCYSMCNE